MYKLEKISKLSHTEEVLETVENIHRKLPYLLDDLTFGKRSSENNTRNRCKQKTSQLDDL